MATTPQVGTGQAAAAAATVSATTAASAAVAAAARANTSMAPAQKPELTRDNFSRVHDAMVHERAQYRDLKIEDEAFMISVRPKEDAETCVPQIQIRAGMGFTISQTGKVSCDQPVGGRRFYFGWKVPTDEQTATVAHLQAVVNAVRDSVGEFDNAKLEYVVLTDMTATVAGGPQPGRMARAWEGIKWAGSLFGFLPFLWSLVPSFRRAAD